MLVKNYKNIIFDLDGTVVDSRKGIINSVLHTLKQFKVKSDFDKRDLYWCINPRLKVIFSRLLNTRDADSLNKAVSIYRKRYMEKGILESSLYNGIQKVLSEYKKSGKNIFIATNKPVAFAENVVKHFDISKYVTKVYGNKLNTEKIKKSSILKNLLIKEKLKSYESLLIGDRKYDMISARVNHIDTAAVLYGYGSETELRSIDPNHLIESVEGLWIFKI